MFGSRIGSSDGLIVNVVEETKIICGVVNDPAHERNGTYNSVEEAKVSKGDKWSGFRYALC